VRRLLQRLRTGTPCCPVTAGRMMDDLAKYLRALAAAGYTVKRGGRNHWKIYDGDMLVASAASTPSGYCALRNLKAYVKRYERAKENAA
jgi:hypothetical protein